MKPEIWGPHAWFLLHSISLEYPDNPTNEDKQNMTTFIESFGKVLPCEKCRVNFKSHLDKYPLNNNSKVDLVKWVIDIHNSVNHMNNKQELSYEECIEHFEKIYDDKPNNSIVLYVCILVLIIIIGVFINKVYLTT